jgi:hypothetical protein
MGSVVNPVPSDVAHALRVMAILGQVLRNYYGSIRAERKEQIATTSYKLLARVLRSQFDLFCGEDRDGLINYIAQEPLAAAQLPPGRATWNSSTPDVNGRRSAPRAELWQDVTLPLFARGRGVERFEAASTKSVTAAVRMWWTLAVSSLPRGASEEETGIETTHLGLVAGACYRLIYGTTGTGPAGGTHHLFPLPVTRPGPSIRRLRTRLSRDSGGLGQLIAAAPHAQ